MRLLLPLLAVLLLSTPLTQAQGPLDGADDFYGTNVVPERGSVNLAFLGAANVPVTVEDVSGPRQTSEEQTPRETGRILFETDVIANDTAGWTASVSKTFVQTQAGDVHDLMLNIQSGATVNEPVVEVRIQATYETPGGEEKVTNASVMAVAESFPRVGMEMAELPAGFTPDEMQRVPVTVTNNNYYPDMVSFRITAPDGWLVSPPSSVRLDPGETKTVYVDVKAPDNPWFKFATSSELFSIDAVSETNGATMVTLGVPVTLSGSNFPAWAAPHMLMLLMGAALIVKRSRRRYEHWRLKQGKPSYPGLDPEHEAEFEALKIEDPDRAEDVADRLQVLYDRRKQAWKEAYKERKRAAEELEDVYSERHETLVEAREADGGPSPADVRRRRQLLEAKRDLLQRKRETMATSDPPDDPDDPDRAEGPTGTPS